MSKSKFIIEKFAKLFEQGIISYKDLSEEIVNIIRSQRDEIVLRMKISTKEETEVLKKRVEKLEKEIKILKSKKIKVRKGVLREKIKNFYSTYFFNRRKKLPYVTGKIAVSKNNLIYSKVDKKITNSKADKFTHLLRYKSDSLMISYKTLNKDNPRLNCRLKGLKSYSPKRIILDNKLNTNINSYIINTANKSNTVIFYNKANKLRILKFKKKGINLISSKINNKGKFEIKILLKKLYKLNCRNLLIEGGDELTNHLLRNKIFNRFFLYESNKKLSKRSNYLNFNSLSLLKQKYKKKINLKLNLGKNKITLYKN